MMNLNKRKLKSLALLSITTALLSSMPNAASAMTDSSDSNYNNDGYVSVDANSADQMSDVMTYDELANQIAKDSKISIKEAKQKLGPETYRSYDEVAKEIAENKGISVDQAKELINPDLIVATRSAAKSSSNLRVKSTFRTFSEYITVSPNYKPQIKWYCQTTEGGGYCGIVKIKDTTLYTQYVNGINKQYKGKLYTNLENANTIFYRLNGYFSTGGNMNVSGGAEIKVSQSTTLNFSVSGNPKNSQYVYKEGRYRVHG